MPKKKFTKQQRLAFHQKSHGRADNASGYKQSAKWRIKKAKQMIDYENEAKRTGKTVTQVIAEAIAV